MELPNVAGLTSTPRPSRARIAAPSLPALAPTLAALAAITAFGALLRLARLGDVPGNPFYDAAVRTMSQSWHAFLFGALDPSGGVSVDKPPVDLWVQVASVKLLGFNATALKLPQALAGTLSIPILFDVVRRAAGNVAGLAAAAALAVLPVAVMTARSDTMDTFMGFLILLSAWMVVRAVESRRSGWLLGAGAMIGLAFNVKLFQALLPVPAIVLLWIVASRVPARRAVASGLAAVLVALVVGFAWIVPVALTPLSQRPYPIGSTNGSIWNLVFVFNGVDRLHGRPLTTPDTLPAGSKVPAAIVRSQKQRARHLSMSGGVMRFFRRTNGPRVGAELAAALAAVVALLLLGTVALARAVRERARALTDSERLSLGIAAMLGVWTLVGFALFGEMRSFHPRYFETISPAVAALCGGGLAWLALRGGRAGRLLAAAVVLIVGIYANALSGPHAGSAAMVMNRGAGHWELIACIAAAAALLATTIARRTAAVVAATLVAAAAVLVVPTSASINVVHARAFDAERSGAMPGSWPPLLDRYLTQHRDGARFAYASVAPAKAAPLIQRDPQPVLMLTSYRSRPLLSVAQLEQRVKAGEVRYFLIGRRCTSALTRHTAACPATARWAIQHSTDVTSRVGIGHQQLLYRINFCVTRRRAGREHAPAEEAPHRPPGSNRRRARVARPRPGVSNALEHQVQHLGSVSAAVPVEALGVARDEHRRRGVRAAVDGDPGREELAHVTRVVRRLAGVGNDRIRRAVNLENRDRPVRMARIERAITAGNRSDRCDLRAQQTADARREAAAVRDARGVHALAVHADATGQLLDQHRDEADVVRKLRVAPVERPEAMRAGGRRVHDDEVVAVRQRRQSRILGHERPIPVCPVECEDDRERPARTGGRYVDERAARETALVQPHGELARHALRAGSARWRSRSGNTEADREHGQRDDQAKAAHGYGDGRDGFGERLDLGGGRWGLSRRLSNFNYRPDVSSKPLAVLVVEDDSAVRRMISDAFTREGHRVLAVADGRAALDYATTDSFDVVLLDVALGEGPNGYEVCRQLRERRNVVPVIMLTALDSEADAVLGLEAGADDYVTKPFGLAELRSRIRAVLRRAGGSLYDEDVFVADRVRLDRSRREVRVDGQLVDLTFSEFELLSAMIANPGRVFSRLELLRAIWGDSAYRDPRGVDVHIRHLREKLEEMPERPHLIITVRGAGYRLQA